MSTTNDYEKYGPPWMSIRLEMMGSGTDWDTASACFDHMQGYIVSLKITGQDPIDVKILDVGHIAEGEGEYYIDGKAGGILYHAVDDNGDPLPEVPDQFVSYEEIEHLGVY